MEKDLLLWNLYDQQMKQAFLHEESRAKSTNFILVIAAAVLAAIVSNKSNTSLDKMLSAFLIVIGLFGSFVNGKHYERYWFHYERARRFRRELELTGVPIKAMLDEADAISGKSANGRLFRSTRLFWLWGVFDIAVVVIGIILLSYVLITGRQIG